jgi:hypothetical protein
MRLFAASLPDRPRDVGQEDRREVDALGSLVGADLDRVDGGPGVVEELDSRYATPGEEIAIQVDLGVGLAEQRAEPSVTTGSPLRLGGNRRVRGARRPPAVPEAQDVFAVQLSLRAARNVINRWLIGHNMSLGHEDVACQSSVLLRASGRW